ncbi:MAG: hypothetical protein KGJ78_16795 [Alphaproteobacteria bacterium]|nr:hypothetical protein [Alphaproteobacteria bacterium]
MLSRTPVLATLFRRAFASSFLKNVLIVVQGNAASVVIMVIALPILSRLFPPSAFGVFQSALSLMSVGLVAASLRYETPILTAKRLTLRPIVSLNFVLNLVTSGIAAVLCIAAYVFFPERLGAVKSVLFLVPFWFLSAGLLQTGTYIALRQKGFAQVSRAKMTQAIGYAALGIVVAKLGWAAAAGLVLADMSGRAFAAASLFIRGRKLLLTDWSSRSARAMKVAAIRYRDYPRISLISATVNTLGGMMTPVLMLMCFSSTVAGQFALVDRSVGTALGVIAQSVYQVYLSTFANSLQSGTDEPLRRFRQTILIQFLIGIVPAIVLAIVFPWLFVLVFGGEWHMAGEFGRILMPLYLVGFSVSPVNMTLMVLENQRTQLAWDCFRLTGVVTIWSTVAVLHVSPYFAMAIHSAFGCTAYLVYMLMADRAVRRRVQNGSARVAPPTAVEA